MKVIYPSNFQAFLIFADSHWILAGFFVYIAAKMVAFMWNRFLRTIKVALRGWPPPHVDADGDWPKTKEGQ